MRAEYLVEFREFANTCRMPLVRTAYLLCGCSGVAENLARRALEDAAVHWDRLRRDPDRMTWVRRSMVGMHVVQSRRGRFADALRGRDSRRSGGDGLSDVAGRSVLMAALSALPPRQRVVIVLRYGEGLDERVVAEQLGCAFGTVPNLAARAFLRLGGDGQQLRDGLADEVEQAVLIAPAVDAIVTGARIRAVNRRWAALAALTVLAAAGTLAAAAAMVDEPPVYRADPLRTSPLASASASASAIAPAPLATIKPPVGYSLLRSGTVNGTPWSVRIADLEETAMGTFPGPIPLMCVQVTIGTYVWKPDPYGGGCLVTPADHVNLVGSIPSHGGVAVDVEQTDLLAAKLVLVYPDRTETVPVFVKDGHRFFAYAYVAGDPMPTSRTTYDKDGYVDYKYP